jgi:hypothetical protein
MEDKSQKREKIEKIIHLLWDSYQNMYLGRTNNTQNNINFILIVESFLLVIGISLYTHFNNTIFFIPILLQLGALLILISSFFFSGLMHHWFEIDETLNNLKNGTFYENFFAELKALEDLTYEELIFYRGIIKKSIWLVLFSIYSTVLAILFIFFSGICLYILTILLTLSLFILIAYYKKLSKDSLNDSHAKFDERFEHYRKRIVEWMEN